MRTPQIIGNGDVMNFTDFNDHISKTGVATCMIARGALIKVLGCCLAC